ncbi:hypothetical protein EDB85DRAFT_1899272 [Lactarius pseudohatsudake]|nr:hypothetical protein EDB85DRAFT_1899272 [Lactarius pseudohatsudake]
MGDKTSTRTHTHQKPVPGLMGMGSGSHGYGYQRVTRVWKPVRVGTSLVSASESAPSISGSFAQGLGVMGVEYCKVARTPSRDASCRAGLVDHRWSETVAHACAQHETLTKAARECGDVGRRNGVGWWKVIGNGCARVGAARNFVEAAAGVRNVSGSGC